MTFNAFLIRLYAEIALHCDSYTWQLSPATVCRSSGPAPSESDVQHLFVSNCHDIVTEIGSQVIKLVESPNIQAPMPVCFL